MKKDIIFDVKSPVTTDFKGVNAVYHGFAGFPDSDGRIYPENICELEADIAANMGLKIARTYYKWYAYENGQWNWDNENMTALYRWLARMKRRSIDVALNMCFCFPGAIYSESPSWEPNSPFTVLGNWDESLSNYAEWVNETVYQLVEKRGFDNVKYLLLFTEPSDKKKWVLPDGKDHNECFAQAVRAVHDRLLKSGRRGYVSLVGPNQNILSCGTHLLPICAEKVSDCLDIFSAHMYSRYRLYDETDVHSGKRSVFFSMPGQRIQQKIMLKGGIQYTISAWLKMKYADRLTVSGNVLLGLFNVSEGKEFFEAGGQSTTRFHLDSVRMIDAVNLDEHWQNFSHTVFVEEDCVAFMGIFSDIKNEGVVVLADDIKMIETNGTENLIENGSFESESGWQMIYSTPVSYDSYHDWTEYCRLMMEDLPKNKPFWYDEYNSHYQHEKRFTDPLKGIWLAEANVAMMSCGVQSSFIWSLFDQQWPNSHTNNKDGFVDGVHKHGVVPLLNSDASPYPAYYAFSLLTRYMSGGSGTAIYREMNQNNPHAVMSVWPNEEISVLVVNGNRKGCDISIKLPKDIVQERKEINRCLYDPENLHNSGFELIKPSVKCCVNNTIEDTLPPLSFAIYTTL